MPDLSLPKLFNSPWQSASEFCGHALSVLLNGFATVEAKRGATARGYFELVSGFITKVLEDVDEALNLDCSHLFIKDVHDPTQLFVSTSSAKASIFRRERLPVDSSYLNELARQGCGQELELLGLESHDRLWALLWETMAIGPYARSWSIVGFPLMAQSVVEPIGFVTFVGPREWYSRNAPQFEIFFSVLVPLFATTAGFIRIMSRLATLYDWTTPALRRDLISAGRLHGVLAPLQRLELKLQISEKMTEQSQPRRDILDSFDRMRSEISEVKRCVFDFFDSREMSQATQQEEGSITFSEAKRVTDRVMNSLRELAVRNEKEIIIRFSPFPAIRIDATSFESIVKNLVHNAIKYGDPGTKVKISADKGRDRVILEVTSYGFGISAGEREKIFQPGYRTAEASKIEYTAAGLGLFAARNAAERWGGHLYLKGSELEVGQVGYARVRYRNTFRLELPFEG